MARHHTARSRSGCSRPTALTCTVTGSRAVVVAVFVVAVLVAASLSSAASFGVMTPAHGTRGETAPRPRDRAPRRPTHGSRAERPPRPAWSGPEAVEHGAVLDSVSCVSRHFCVALAASGAAYAFDGSKWSGPTQLGSPISGRPTTGRSELDCVSRSFCAAIAGRARAYVDTGARWRALPAPPGALALQAVSCSSATFCMVIDGIGDAYVFDGRSWSSALNGWGAPSSLSCPSATSCVAVGVGASSWNGQRWTEPAPVDALGLLSAVSCSTTSRCVAVDDEGNALVFDGGRWSAPRAVAGARGADLTAISCAPGGACTAVGTRGLVVSSIQPASPVEPARWTRPVPLGDRTDLRGVSCVAGGFCVAVDAAGDAFVDS